MASTGGGQDRDWLWPMALVAVLVHGLVLLIVLPERDLGRQPPLALQWLEPSPPETPEPAPVEVTEPEDERSPAPEPESSPMAEPDMAPESLVDDTVETHQPAPASPSSERLRELALIAGRAQTERTPPSRPGLEGFAVPRLPGEAGWLNDYVGTVTPRAERWVEADGSRAARVLTSSGQVYCGRARAPTAAEEFNPWMSAVVMTWRTCGQERPEPTDRTNPWLRGQGLRRD